MIDREQAILTFEITLGDILDKLKIYGDSGEEDAPIIAKFITERVDENGRLGDNDQTELNEMFNDLADPSDAFEDDVYEVVERFYDINCEDQH